MDAQVVEIQKVLNQRGANPPLQADGVAGFRTMAAIDAELRKKNLGIDTWSDFRRQIAFTQLVMADAGIDVGAIDGIVGEQTRHAIAVFAARRANNGQADPKIEQWRDVPAPPSTVTKWPLQKDVPAFFGEVGQHQVMVELPFPMRIAWEPSKTIGRYSCHEKVQPSISRIWSNVLKHYGYERLKELRLDMFGGCLNVRKMRGGSSWSMHSWGIATDVDPDRNQLTFHKAQSSLAQPVYAEYWKIVYAEGAIGLGPERDYDWMHWQFARL